MAQKRAVLFHLDLKSGAASVRPSDIHVHVRQLIDRSLYLDSTGSVDEQKLAAAFADKIDTNVAVNSDYAFTLRNLNTGAAYRISVYYRVPLDTLAGPAFSRMRASYQEVKINSWAYEYHLPAAQPCAYDATLHRNACPKCHRSDKVLPILYGDGITDDVATLPATGSYYQSEAGSTDCDPNWYCSRDRIRF